MLIMSYLLFFVITQAAVITVDLCSIDVLYFDESTKLYMLWCIALAVRRNSRPGSCFHHQQGEIPGCSQTCHQRQKGEDVLCSCKCFTRPEDILCSCKCFTRHLMRLWEMKLRVWESLCYIFLLAQHLLNAEFRSWHCSH